jgi:hypothetical protein
MKRTAMFVAGAVFALAAFATQPNSENEERYRAKYGRYTQSYERWDKAPAKFEVAACCRNMNALVTNEPRESSVEALFRAKYGRSAPRVEAHEKLVADVKAKHVRTCVELGNCALMKSERKGLSTAKVAQVSSWSDEFYRAKYGRALPEAREVVHLSAVHVTCDHECCRRSD